MGAGIIHVYKASITDIPKEFRKRHFICKSSDDWVTLVDSFFTNLETQYYALRLSEIIDKPVLSFASTDRKSYLQMCEAGRRIAYIYYNAYSVTRRKLQLMLDKLEIDQSELKRLYRLLECEDVLKLTRMLEEFFGIPLIMDKQMYFDRGFKYRKIDY
ncbi:MAG TPA: hypothetical protein GXZ66_08325 [Clostridiaceae bacterium]|jgi:hypothetical protein|nr:hypothetical protein [Clostridiaceae bacterium]